MNTYSKKTIRTATQQLIQAAQDARSTDSEKQNRGIMFIHKLFQMGFDTEWLARIVASAPERMD